MYSNVCKLAKPKIELNTTANGDVLGIPGGQSVRSASELRRFFKSFEEVPVTVSSQDGSETATFTVKNDELENFVRMFVDI